MDGEEEDVSTVCVYAGNKSNGSEVLEELHVSLISKDEYLLLNSPGLVLGLAAGDRFRLTDGGRFVVLERGGNLCVQIFFRLNSDLFREEAEKIVGSLGGRLDGSSNGQLVYTISVGVGFQKLEAALDQLVGKFPGAEWYYGNVYDHTDGVTPLNWWLDLSRPNP